VSVRHLLASLVLILVSLTATAQQMPVTKGLRSGLTAATPPVSAPPARMHGAATRRPMMIELSAEPTAVVFARERDRASAKGGSAEAIADQAAVAQLAVVEAEQAPFVEAIRRGDIAGTFLYSIQRVGNGIAAEMSVNEAARVAAMPGVRAVVPLALMSVDRSSSVPLIGAPALWSPNLGSGHRGEGIRIGIIDTGVDYLHVDLGGTGVYSRTDFTAGNVPWNAKVVGGTDLAGDNYDAGSPDPNRRTPHPDPDPMDCDGHGSHVAGIAAGLGVRANGTAFTGPYGSSIDPSAFRIGPGVAPAAQIYAIRIFGCSGVTALEAQALDWAIDPNRDGNLSDHLDVVNMSIGTDYGAVLDTASMAAADTAALAGMVVVASAGNAGDSHYIMASPAAATRVISVAASVDSTDTVDSFVVTSPASIAGSKNAMPSANYPWSSMTTPLTAALAYPPSQRTGCQTFTPANAALLAGKIALLDWTDDDCNSGVRVQNAVMANAVGVLFAYNNHTRIDITIGGSGSIPAMITLQTVADAIKNALPATIRFDSQLLGTGQTRLVDNTIVDTLTNFTSRGPRSVDGLLKPDITAPGSTIFSVKARSGNLGLSDDGTSMAAPMVAGGMALLKQIHPDWTVEELKALAMNSAAFNLYSAPSKTTPLYAPAAVGAGRFSLPDAATLDVLAYAVDNPGSGGISFGFVEVPGQISVQRQFRVVNKSSTTAVVTLSYTPVTVVPGVSFDFPGGTTLSIAPNASVTASLRLTADSSQMKHRRDPAMHDKQGGYPRYWVTEASGNIQLLRGFEPLRLPVEAIVQPSSSMTGGTTPISLKTSSGHTTIPLTGDSFQTGTAYPDDWVSLVSPLELQEAHDRTPTIPAVRNLQYVGVTSDYHTTASSIADTVIYFGIAAFGSWSSPAEIDYEIGIDVNGDGHDDYLLYNTSGGTFLAPGTKNDVHIAALCPLPFPTLPSSSCSAQYLNGFAASDADTAVFNTDVIRFPVAASQLGLTAGHSQFTYRVYIYNPVSGGLTDSTARLTFDPAHSLNLFANFSSGTFLDNANNSLSIDWTAGDINAGTRGILLLHHFNADGQRAEVIPTSTAIPRRRSVLH
jgi:hypothetical protein